VILAVSLTLCYKTPVFTVDVKCKCCVFQRRSLQDGEFSSLTYLLTDVLTSVQLDNNDVCLCVSLSVCLCLCVCVFDKELSECSGIHSQWSRRHSRSQGVQWVHLHPLRAEINFCRRNLQGKFVSAPAAHQVHPSDRARVNFVEFSLGGGDLEV